MSETKAKYHVDGQPVPAPVVYTLQLASPAGSLTLNQLRLALTEIGNLPSMHVEYELEKTTNLFGTCDIFDAQGNPLRVRWKLSAF